MSARHKLGLTLIATALGCGACAARSPNLRLQLESFDPVIRVRAVTSAAEQGIMSLIPALVDRLDDEDSAVRLYTILALEKLTNQRLGYAYSAPRVQRRAAIENWRRYVSHRAQTSSDGADQSDSKPAPSPVSAITPRGITPRGITSQG